MIILTLILNIKTIMRKLKNLEPGKCSELRWFDIIPNDKRAINNMNNKTYLDEYDFN